MFGILSNYFSCRKNNAYPCFDVSFIKFITPLSLQMNENQSSPNDVFKQQSPYILLQKCLFTVWFPGNEWGGRPLLSSCKEESDKSNVTLVLLVWWRYGIWPDNTDKIPLIFLAVCAVESTNNLDLRSLTNSPNWNYLSFYLGPKMSFNDLSEVALNCSNLHVILYVHTRWILQTLLHKTHTNLYLFIQSCTRYKE